MYVNKKIIYFDYAIIGNSYFLIHFISSLSFKISFTSALHTGCFFCEIWFYIKSHLLLFLLPFYLYFIKDHAIVVIMLLRISQCWILYNYHPLDAFVPFHKTKCITKKFRLSGFESTKMHCKFQHLPNAF